MKKNIGTLTTKTLLKLGYFELKLPLKCCQHLEIHYTVRKRVDLVVLKILGLQVKGLQS